MINRTIKDIVVKTIKNKPVTLITGARQVGKTTLCKTIMNDMNFNYVSLDNLRDRSLAIEDPELFLKTEFLPIKQKLFLKTPFFLLIFDNCF